jgi:hypothetical protein
VDVEVTQKKGFVSWHHSTPNSQLPTPKAHSQILTSTCVVSLGRPRSSSDVKLRT